MAIEYIGFSHVGIVVPSIDRFVKTWGGILGLKDWVRQEVTHEHGIVQHLGATLSERAAGGQGPTHR